MEIKLTEEDFKECFEPRLSPYIQDKIREYGFIHRDLDIEEQYECLRVIWIKLINNITQSGEHRLGEWDKGWEENLISGNIVPKYFGKYNIVRWKRLLVKALSPDYEVNMLYLIVDWLADKYMRDAHAIYEFGCGTGHHLTHVRAVNKNASLYGLDWAESSQQIVNNLAKELGDQNLFSKNFDFFNPDNDFTLASDSIVYTVASLEQTGNRYYTFLDYLLRNKPKLCIHIEPIAELLDNSNLLDYLSIEYFKKRKYLSGFLTTLRQLEKEGRINIIKAQRTYVGSMFIEGYSVVVWEIR